MFSKILMMRTLFIVEAGVASSILMYVGMRGKFDRLRIVPGVSIAGIDVSNLTDVEAKSTLQPLLDAQVTSEIIIRHPSKPDCWRKSLQSLAFTVDADKAIIDALALGGTENVVEKLVLGDKPRQVDIVLNLTVPESRWRPWLRTIAHQLNRQPLDAHAFSKQGVGLTIDRKSQPGERVDIEQTWAHILADSDRSLINGADTPIVLNMVPAKIETKDLASLGTLRSAYFTNYSSSSINRKHNLWIAAQKLDGKFLKPGETFSYNNVVGARTGTNGWKIAHQFQDGQVVDGVGGGVCQSSSTLYNAVLLGGFKIRERHNHSLPVTYLNPGRDASVSYGHLDFRFQNNSDSNVYLSVAADGQKFHVRIYAQTDSVTPRVSIQTTEPFYLPDGSYKVSSRRTLVYPDGKTEFEDLGWDKYSKAKPLKPVLALPVSLPTVQKTKPL